MRPGWFFRLRVIFFTMAGITFASFAVTELFLFASGGRGASLQTERSAFPEDTFVYSFNVPGVLQEVRNAAESPSPYWFLDSGGALVIEDGVGGTIQQTLPPQDHWRVEYERSNPIDTDNGFHPQNIFRLVTKSRWENFSQQARFYIAGDNFSASPNRGASNGLLFMSRYTGDGQTLYYAGIRVDGTAVIKKKYRGTYYTMAQATLFRGVYSRDSVSSRNLLPHNEWLGLKLTTVTNADGSVTLALYLQRNGQAAWTEVLFAIDKRHGGTPPITGSNFAGIRTDFMDIKFDDYRVENISAPS